MDHNIYCKLRDIEHINALSSNFDKSSIDTSDLLVIPNVEQTHVPLSINPNIEDRSDSQN